MLRPLIQEIATAHTPESMVDALQGHEGVVLLRTSAFDSGSARYSLVVAQPFLTFSSLGSGCEIVVNRPPDSGTAMPRHQRQFGNPWHVLESLMSRFELLDEIDLPFPLGGAFGFWGYDLKNFTEPKLPRRAINDLELPDCQVGFYDSLMVFDHRLNTTFVVSTGLTPMVPALKNGPLSNWNGGDPCWPRYRLKTEPNFPGPTSIPRMSRLMFRGKLSFRRWPAHRNSSAPATFIKSIYPTA